MFGRVSLIGPLALTPLLLAGCDAPEAAAVLVSETAQQDWAQACEDWDDWDKPAPAFRVHGGTYHVGTCGISAVLVDSGSGLILLDSGTEGGADVIAANIASLGLDIGDVALLLQSHEHFDHIGGMAKLKRMSGARLLASAEAALVLERGQTGPDDPQNGTLDPFEAVQVDGTVQAGSPVQLGALSMMPIATPGHTPGALSWWWESCDDAGECLSIVYADSLSPISGDDYRFSDHPEYVADYRDGLARLAALDCDILLTPHPSASAMRDKLLAGDMTSGPRCTEYAASINARLDARLAEEAEGTS